MLDALTNAVAARFGKTGGGIENNTVCFKFSAAKNHTQGNYKKKDKKKGGQNRDENARKQVIGKKGDIHLAFVRWVVS